MAFSIVEIGAVVAMALGGSGIGGWKMIAFVRKNAQEAEQRANANTANVVAGLITTDDCREAHQAHRQAVTEEIGKVAKEVKSIDGMLRGNGTVKDPGLVAVVMESNRILDDITTTLKEVREHQKNGNG